MTRNTEGEGYCDGNSTVVEAAIHGRPGILNVKMSSAGSKEEALHQMQMPQAHQN